MKVLLVSAIFESAADFRAVNLQESSETLLASGLRDSGVDVDVRGHSLRNDWNDFDLVHIHHLANSCVSLFLPQRPRIVFTRHATKAVPLHHRIVLRRAYARSDAVIFLSDVERDMAGHLVRGDRGHVIHNGLNGENFPASLRRTPVPGQRWKLLYVGQLIELKRVELAIRLVADLIRQGYDVELDVVSHRDTLRSRLTNQASLLGIADRIVFLGPRTRSDLGQIMARSHILLLPSRTEALPTVVTEAAYTGLPVAAFQVGGISEQLPSSTILPEILDYNGFQSQVRGQLDDYPNTAQAYFEHSDRVRTNFSTNKMVQEHLNVYNSIIGAGE